MLAAKVVLRVVAAALGGYSLTAVLVALLAGLLVRFGLARSEAVVSASIAGFLIYLAVLVWAFGTVKLRTLWAGLAACTGAAYGLLLLTR